jgi:hypothetical protein
MAEYNGVDIRTKGKVLQFGVTGGSRLAISAEDGENMQPQQ